MKAMLIMNPGSRSGRGRRLWPGWESSLRARGVSFDSVTTLRAGHAVELAAGAVDYDTVVAVGGDGTINEVLDGVVRSGRSDLRMGVLYSGTSPDFCRFHGIPLEPAAAVERLVSGSSRRVDVGRIVYTGSAGGRTTAHFGCGCNVGLGAAVARVSNRIRGFTGDLLGTCLAVIFAVAAARPVTLRIAVDGGPEQLLAGVNNFAILKNPSIASGLRLNLDLRADDGRLVLFGVHGKGRAGLLSVLPGFYSGRAVDRADVFKRECRRLTVGCTERTEIEFDGDPHGFLPAEIELLPRALDLIGAGNEGI